MTRYVLDSSAIICYLRDEPGADALDALLVEPDNQYALHAVNWVEVRYIEQRGQLPAGDSFRHFLEAVGVELSSELSPAYLEKAASLKTHYPPIALGDCFAAALAQTLNATLITTDRNELRKVAEAGACAIVFLR